MGSWSAATGSPLRAASAWLLLLSLLLGGCGVHFSKSATPSPEPRRSPSSTPPQGGIASGAAAGPLPITTAAPAAPAAVVPQSGSSVPPMPDGTCPASHPVKIGHDERAHPPGSLGYEAVQPISCYATLADADANGYRP